MFSLEGKTAVVTGGASGIGLATVKRFAEAGAEVVIADLKDAGELARRVNGLFVETDVSEEAQVEHLMRRTADTYGKIDIVINNAGGGNVSEYNFIPALSTADFDACYRSNLMGTVYGIKHSVKFMTGGGSIVNMSSVAGYQGTPTYSPYVAAKAAVIGITKTAALELAPSNIRVNCVCPGTVDTPLARRKEVERELKMAAIMMPLGRICEPEEVAALCHFLVADDCSFVSGQAICIDGGMTAGMGIGVAMTLLESV